MTSVAAISLFSGAGGLDVGAFLSNVNVIVSTDIASDAIETLRQNSHFNKTELILDDLHEIRSERFNFIAQNSKADKVIVIGGAPCQPFSKAGYWVGNNARKGINDPRALLVNEYLRVVQDLNPDGFVFENVESLGHPTNRSLLEGFIEIAEIAGFKTKIIKGNALDYGVPQKRKRLFIIGTKGAYKTDVPTITHAESSKADLIGLLPYVTAGEAIREFDTDEFFEPQELAEYGTYGKDLLEIPPGSNYKALTSWAGYENPKFVADKRFWSFLLKLSPDQPSWTITAQPGPWVGPFHWNSRRLRVPEIAAIQSFPKHYKFYGNRRSIQRQIGNAVPPLMARAMINHLKESLV
ncbi:DNA cytosine methyltransferase [Cohnella sp. JJ-181]|uniref:DNA cytosine methyltransferase n=1 Tax=Cohnella rhizoplanae TaxID=2974897 RepID=UPI0022FFA682|nr:DNA cytosine methyltransferase [Cohnella sp. JJ-181]CAI6086028.1 Modification methylase BspRI [Cohnella sp. JJ-181]